MKNIDKILKSYFSEVHNIKKIAGAVTVMSTSDRMYFLSLVLKDIGSKERKSWLDKIATIEYNQKWLILEEWMEGVFIKDMTRPPIGVANMAVTYLKINKKMLPFLIKKAQKVKHRVVMRQHYKKGV